MSNRTLPATSHAANRQAAQLKEAHQNKIVECLQKYPDGLIYEEIAKWSLLEPHAVGRRLSELERQKRITKTGKTRKTTTGREACIYKLPSIADFSRGLVQKKLF